MSVVSVQPHPREVIGSLAQSGSARSWIFGPWLDLFLIANVAWPLLLLLPLGEGFAGQSALQFWQLYYITTPHRWATLLLVFLDRDRFGQRRTTFLAIAIVVIVACLSVRITTGALTCLMALDYLWNAWHFASQHHGIYRIYGRLDNPARTAGVGLEKWALRGFLLYVILRVATTTWADPSLHEYLSMADWAAAIVPVGLLLWRVPQARGRPPGAVVYLLSVLALYSGLLCAVHFRQLGLVLALATASALFHALEYLALVSWSVAQRHGSIGDRMGVLGYLAPRWGLTLAVFVLVLGAGGWLMDQHFLELWLAINVVAAFLHYAYDGLIWRRPAVRTGHGTH